MKMNLTQSMCRFVLIEIFCFLLQNINIKDLGFDFFSKLNIDMKWNLTLRQILFIQQESISSSSPTIEQSNSSENLELLKQKETVSESDCLFPQKDESNTLHAPLMDLWSSSSDDGLIENDCDMTDGSEIFEGFMKDASPEANLQKIIPGSNEQRIEVSVIIGGPTNKTELTGSKITLKVRNSIVTYFTKF